MARQIPGGSKFLTLSSHVETPEYNSRKDDHEHYTIDDLIFTAVGPGVSGNAGSLAELVNITNNDGAYSHLSNVYSGSVVPAGTSIEVLLRSILNPYIQATINLSSLNIGFRTGTGASEVWSSYNDNNSSSIVLEAGQGYRISSFYQTVSDSSLTLDDSFSFSRNNQTGLITGSSDVTGSIVLPTVFTFESITPPGPSGNLHSFVINGTDNGGGVETTIQSNAKTISFYNRVKIGASDQSTATTIPVGQALFSELSLKDLLIPKTSNLSFVGDANTNDQSKYTWIAFPINWGNPTDIVQAATSIIDDFEERTTIELTNEHGSNMSYYFYRSTSKGAFGVGANITVKFN